MQREPQANFTPFPLNAAIRYSPILDQRRCPGCGRRDNWHQIAAIGGGWSCCWPRDGALDHGAFAHVCGPRCADEGRGARW